MLFSISSKNYRISFREREVFSPTASCSWVSGLLSQAYNWDWGGSVSLASASVRLGGSVLSLSHHRIVSPKLSDLGENETHTTS